MRSLSIGLSLPLFLLACNAIKNNSENKITNGIKSQPKRLSAVIYQDGCTGTFVSPTTILTAAHCADKGFTYKGERSLPYPSMVDERGEQWNFSSDLRILTFKKAVAPAWIPVSSLAVSGDEDVIVAGFGTYDLKEGKNDGQFRYGTTTLEGFEHDGRLLISYGHKAEKVEGEVGTESGVGPGDSGGAMLRDGKLIGVNVGVAGVGDDRSKSITVNLSSKEAVAYLKNAQKKGIDIRFDGQGSIPFEECFDVNAQEQKLEVVFEVPHRNLKSAIGEWSICNNCELTDAQGYETTPNVAQFKSEDPIGALIAKADSETMVFAGKTATLKKIAFDLELAINDEHNFADNRGTVRACFE